MYYSFITMTTIGYGDITPTSNIEKLYAIFTTLIACGIFGYSMNVIGGIFSEIARNE